MFLRKKATSGELARCEDRVAYLKAVAEEKCRPDRRQKMGDYTYLWSHGDCKESSKKVVQEVEKCMQLAK